MKKPFTVLHLDGERGLRGGERQLLYLACALRARGHRNLVVCRAGSPLESEARRLSLETRSLPYWCEWDPVSALRLARLASELGRPIIHAHTAHAASVAALASSAGGPPAVAHRRVDFPASGSASLSFKYGRAARVVAVSDAIARVLEKDGLPRERTAVVPDAIPVSSEECGWAGMPGTRFSPPDAAEKAAARAAISEEFGLDPGLPWIGNLAALVPHKDHDTLVASAMIAIMRRPTLRFLIAGRGPEEAKLWRQIQGLGLVGKVLLLGHREDPAALLKALDIFCLSSWGEGMGSVLLEAAACRLPIAATTAGGIPEVVSDGETGLLVKPRDPEALAAALVRLHDEPALARRLAEEGLRRLPRFGLTTMAERMEEVYSGL